MSDNLDFMAIFGGEGNLDLGSGGEDFGALFAEKETTAPQPPEEKVPETTAETAQPEEVLAEVSEPEQKKEDANAPEEEKPETPPQPAAAPEKKPAAPKVSGKPSASPANPFEAAMRQVEEKITQDLAGELLQKPPVFQFGGVTEEITDPEKTFEQLRSEKQADFPELEDSKRVSWTMEYGKITKTIPKPKDSVIHAMKAEIEKSEGFRDMLKKAKDKDFTCKVRPHIAAQSKGIASYKGIFSSLEEMEKSPKVINLVPARDGHVYEIRCLESGRFITRARNIPEMSEIREGFYPNLPLIPFELVQQIIGFFRSYMRDGAETEALVRVYWNRMEERFLLDIPHQKVSKARIFADIPIDPEKEDGLIHYADIHSHNSMAAQFSSIDDADEKGDRLYLVMGRLDQYFPEVSARICNGGTFLPIHPGDVLEGVPREFPDWWSNRVQLLEDSFPITGEEDAGSWKGAMAA
ncbi:hypothetical protein D1157_10210 [Anaerotruncus sp. X29]|nr:hypothetical protein [Anaerotruncus sp. X29]